MRVWFQGRMQDGPIEISAADRGLTLGDGIFETLLVLNEHALWREPHLARMKAAAHELAIFFPEDEIAAALKALCKGAVAAHVLRLTLTRGTGGRGLAADIAKPMFVASLAAFDTKLMFQPLTLVTSHIRRNGSSPASRLKTLSYVDQILAAREAHKAGADDALMLNTDGHVACSTIGNIFILNGRQLVTPSLDQGILPGILRQVVIDVARGLDMDVEERPVAAAEALGGKAVFMTNSLRIIRPVTALDGHHFHTAMLDDLIQGISALARQQCGVDLPLN